MVRAKVGRIFCLSEEANDEDVDDEHNDGLFYIF